MSANFFSLPREIRDMIYKLCLLNSDPMRPFGYRCHICEVSPDLLQASKTVHNEARSVLYQNRIDFTNAAPSFISLFFGEIGSNNADCIRHVYVEFPNFCDLEVGNVTIDARWIESLGCIKRGCANLRTLTISQVTYPIELLFGNYYNEEVVTEALTFVNTLFRATFPSVHDIIIEVYGNDPSGYIRKQIENQGWSVLAREPIYISDFDE